MLYAKADLNDDVVTSYDKTKTTVFGRCAQHTVEGKTVIGPPLNKFLDITTDTGITMAASNIVMSPNGRLFVLSGEASGLVVAALYTVDYSTLSTTYVGKVQFALPDVAATTIIFRSIKVLDSGTTGWKLMVTTTANVLINGGSFLVNDLALSDFVQVGFPTIPFATGNSQKAVYFMQDPANTGVSQLQIASAGSVLNPNDSKLYVHNGVSATHQYYVYDMSIAPTYTADAVTGTAATDLINHAGHAFVDNTPVTFTTLTGGAGLTNLTTYFVRSAVPGVSYQLSATTGGAAINFTTDITSATIGRAFGTSHANYLHKTGNLPALLGTLLIVDAEDYAVPLHSTNSGQDCAFFATSSTLYMGKLSDLTSGATSWPSLISANTVGAPGEYTATTLTNATWSNVLDRAVFAAGNIFLMSQMVNNQIDVVFGGANNTYREASSSEGIALQFPSAISALDFESGVIGMAHTATVGARGITLADVRSDALFEHSYVITKVIDTPDSVYKFVTTTDALYDYTGSLAIYYRTSDFDTLPGTWLPLPFADDLTSSASGTQVQFKILFSTLGLDTSIPAQLQEFFIGYESNLESSSHWELSVDDTDNGNPSRTAFRLKTVYSSSVPTLRYRAYDLSSVLLVSHDTVTDAARFQYSTDSGVSWNSGTIPNTVGTLVRYTFATPPGVDIRPSLKEA